MIIRDISLDGKRGRRFSCGVKGSYIKHFEVSAIEIYVLSAEVYVTISHQLQDVSIAVILAENIIFSSNNKRSFHAGIVKASR